MGIVSHIKDRVQGKVPAGARRSGKWPKVRADHLAKHPTCALCGGNRKIEVHHIKPFHLHPALELEPTNLITLCESGANGINCHLAFGHLGSFKSVNSEVVADSSHMGNKIKNRP
jgi:5-methylcytosine-specific restriction endonuclease McrA